MQEETGRYCLLPTFIPSQFSMSHHMGLSTFSVPSLWEKYTEKVFFFFCQLCFPGYQHHHHTHKLNCILKTSYKHKENNSQFTFILKKSLKSLWQATILDTPQQADTQEFNIHFSETIFSLLDSAPKTAFKSNSSIWHQHFWQSDYR